MPVTFQGRQFDTWQEARASLAAAPIAAAPVETFNLESPPASAAAARPPAKQSLTEKYRPRTLGDIAGQPAAVSLLRAFAADPYSAAFILAGETGTGKTSAAWALAADLGCNIDASPPEFGGIYSIPSGEHNADRLRELWPQLWTYALGSSRGWKVLIVNEVEQLNGVVEKLWLDKLEDLPPSTAVIFTTNNLDSLPARFVDRCIGGVIKFRSTADDLSEAARTLAGSIWRAEKQAEIPADVLERVIAGSIRAGQLSLRRVVAGLVPLIGGAPCR